MIGGTALVDREAARPSRLRRLRPPGVVTATIVGLLLSGLVVAPILAVALRLVDAGDVIATIRRVLTGEPYTRAFGRTALIGILAASGSTVLATCLAWLVHRTDLPGRRTFAAMVVVPFFIPLIVTAVAWTLLSAEESGLINRAFRALGVPLMLDVHGVAGIVFVLAVGLTPVAYFFVRDALAEPATEQEEAALVAGATAPILTLRITLPRILPTLGATFLIILVLAAANFSVPAVLGLSRRIDVLSTQIFVAMNSYPVSYPRVATVALTLVVLLVGLLVIQQRLEQRGRVSSQHVGRSQPIIWRLGAWRWPCFALVALYFCLALVLPLGAVAIASVLPYAGAPLGEATLENFARVLDSTGFRTGIANTLVLATFGASAAVAIGTLGAYMFRRLRPPGAGLWDVVISAPIALPGIVIGLGYLWLAVGSPAYGTLALTTAVVVVRFIPFALRSGTAALTRIDRSLDEAARIAGARERHVFGAVILPGLRTSVLSMWALLFILFTHEVDTNVLLQGTENGVLAVQIYSWYGNGGTDLAAAGSVILLLLTAAVFAAMAVVLPRREGRGAVP